MMKFALKAPFQDESYLSVHLASVLLYTCLNITFYKKRCIESGVQESEYTVAQISYF